MGVWRLDSYTKPGSVVVTMPHAFASGWLMPQMARMVRDLPGIEPWVATSDEAPDFTHSEVDLPYCMAKGSETG